MLVYHPGDEQKGLKGLRGQQEERDLLVDGMNNWFCEPRGHLT